MKNNIAKSLRNRALKLRIIKAKKGRGSYCRKTQKKEQTKC